MQKFPFFKQYDTMDCGPTCIRMAAKHYGKVVNMETLRNAAQLSKDGVSLLGIAEAAEKIGFNAKGVTLSYNQLIKEAKLPAIIHWEQNHFKVPAPKAIKRKYKYHPPGKEPITYTTFGV